MVTNQFMLAVIQAVKAEYTFAYPDISSRLTAAFAGFFAQFAIDTFAFFFAYSPDSKSANQAKQRPQRTDESAVEAGDIQVKQNHR